MSSLQQFREGLHEAWGTLVGGWQRLTRHAAGAITRFTPARKTESGEGDEESHEIAVRSAGWGGTGSRGL